MLISATHIGGTGSKNSYKDIGEILSRLGIVATPQPAHENHFHVYLKPPAPLSITAHLLANNVDTGGAGDMSTLQQQAAQVMLGYAQSIIEGEEFVFTLDIPYAPPQETPSILAQAANKLSQPDYLLKTCDEVPSAGG